MTDLYKTFVSSDLMFEMEGGGRIVFNSSNQNNLICSSVSASDDDAVENSSNFILRLTTVFQNDRVTLQPQFFTVTVEDNDST